MSPQQMRAAIARRLATLDRLERTASRRQTTLLQALRREIEAVIIHASGFNQLRLQQILNDVNRLIREVALRSAAAGAEDLRVAWGTGVSELTAALSTAQAARFAFGTFGGVSGDMLTALVDVLFESQNKVWAELGARLRVEIRRAVVGVIDPQKAMANVARSIRNTKGFATAAARAEMIVRTEVRRTFEMAHNLTAQRAVDADIDVNKGWLAVHDQRTRPTHVEAGKRYMPGGDPGPIPFAKKFKVGTARMRYPLDPEGPPEETIACRCSQLIFLADATT